MGLQVGSLLLAWKSNGAHALRMHRRFIISLACPCLHWCTLQCQPDDSFPGSSGFLKARSLPSLTQRPFASGRPSELSTLADASPLAPVKHHSGGLPCIMHQRLDEG